MSNLTQNQVLIVVIVAVLLIVGALILLVGDGGDAPEIEEEAQSETYRPADDTSIVVIEISPTL